MAALTVHPLRKEDEPAVRAMMRDLFRSEPSADLDGETVLVAELAGGEGGDAPPSTHPGAGDAALAGFVSLSLRTWAEGCEGTPVPYVEGWFVAPALRGRGIGRALMQAAEEWARTRGFREIGSDADLDNLAAIAAHGRLGFVRTTRLQFFRKELTPLDPAEILDAMVPPDNGGASSATDPGGARS